MAYVGHWWTIVASCYKSFDYQSKTWQMGILHSWGNKFAGLLLFFYLPFDLLRDAFSFSPSIFLSLITLSALEEMIILLTDQKYDLNRKSWLCLFFL